MVREATQQVAKLYKTHRALCDTTGADEAQVENAKTVERDVLLTLWHEVATIALLQYDLQEIDANAKQHPHNTALRLEAYKCREKLRGEIRYQVAVAERKLQDKQLVTDVPETSPEAIDHRKTLTKNIELLMKYEAKLESDDECVKKLLEQASEEEERSLTVRERMRRELHSSRHPSEPEGGEDFSLFG